MSHFPLYTFAVYIFLIHHQIFKIFKLFFSLISCNFVVQTLQHSKQIFFATKNVKKLTSKVVHNQSTFFSIAQIQAKSQFLTASCIMTLSIVWLFSFYQINLLMHHRIKEKLWRKTFFRSMNHSHTDMGLFHLQSSSIPFWTRQLGSSSRSNWTGSWPVTQMAVELINNHLISVQQKRWL